MLDQFINNTKLFGYENFFKEFIDLYMNDNLPNKLIISGPKGSGKSTFGKKIINFFLSGNLSLNKKNIDYNKFNEETNNLKRYINQNFFYIDLNEEKKNIEIDQIRSLINYSQKQSINGLSRFIFINNVEMLNKNASNALLKLLEEPYENMFFILIHNNNYKILDTIKSRCLIFNISFSFQETIKITNKILNLDICNSLNPNLINNYSTVGDLLFIYNFLISNKFDLKNISLNGLVRHLIDEKKYKNDTQILSLLIKLIEVMFYENFLITKDIKFYDSYRYFTYKLFSAVKYNLDLETLFLEFKKKAINE